MKPWIPLIAGALLIMCPQVITAVVAANTAWVESSYLHASATVAHVGAEFAEDPAAILGPSPVLPSMPAWLEIFSVGFGALLCLVSLGLYRNSPPTPRPPSAA